MQTDPPRSWHDMGGDPAGPIPAGNTAVFGEDWHGRALALTLAAGALGQWTLDASRHARETLPHYARLTYYEKWLAALTDLLVQTGVVTRAELTGTSAAPSPLSDRRLTADRVAPALAKGAPATRPGPAPAFAIGQRVRTGPRANNHIPGGHTRLPAYAADRTGTVNAHHGCHVLPDTNAHGLGERPEPLYTVAFSATDLWPDATPGDEVRLDLWQSYLHPA